MNKNQLLEENRFCNVLAIADNKNSSIHHLVDSPIN